MKSRTRYWFLFAVEMVIFVGALALCYYPLQNAGLSYPVVAGFWVGRLCVYAEHIITTIRKERR